MVFSERNRLRPKIGNRTSTQDPSSNVTVQHMLKAPVVNSEASMARMPGRCRLASFRGSAGDSRASSFNHPANILWDCSSERWSQSMLNKSRRYLATLLLFGGGEKHKNKIRGPRSQTGAKLSAAVRRVKRPGCVPMLFGLTACSKAEVIPYVSELIKGNVCLISGG